MRSKVYKMLVENAGKHVSGEKISEELGITRAAVWKHIAAIREAGAYVESISNKGYMLIVQPDKLCREYVLPYVDRDIDIVWREETDSTNKLAKSIAIEKREEFVVMAESQTAGRGRLYRTWDSPAGNIYLSAVIRPNIKPENAAGITLAAAVAVRDAIFSETGIRTGIKWPNDLVIDGKKVCGILTEMSAQPNWVEYIVVGIGINVNQTAEYSEEVLKKATSLKEYSGININRPELAGRIISCLYKRCAEYEAGGFECMREEYTNASIMQGRELSFVTRDGEFSGSFVEFDSEGAMIVKTANGNVKIRTGEASVKGIY